VHIMSLAVRAGLEAAVRESLTKAPGFMAGEVKPVPTLALAALGTAATLKGQQGKPVAVKPKSVANRPAAHTLRGAGPAPA